MKSQLSLKANRKNLNVNPMFESDSSHGSQETIADYPNHALNLPKEPPKQYTLIKTVENNEAPYSKHDKSNYPRRNNENHRFNNDLNHLSKQNILH